MTVGDLRSFATSSSVSAKYGPFITAMPGT